jgi:hypothetical protein
VREKERKKKKDKQKDKRGAAYIDISHFNVHGCIQVVIAIVLINIGWEVLLGKRSNIRKVARLHDAKVSFVTNNSMGPPVEHSSSVINGLVKKKMK